MAEKKAPQHNVTIKWETVSLISVQKTQPLSKKKTETSSIILEQKKSYTTEFRNFDDDAWYTVMVTMEGKQTLRIKYEKFSDEEDQLFEPSFFESLEALHEFEKRFRPLSVQVQDYECRKLVHGVKVQERKHSRKKDAECLCTFILDWLHGPNAGNLTAAEVGDICIVQPVIQLDPTVASFLEIARRVIESKSGQEMGAYYLKDLETSERRSFFERMQKGKQRVKRSALGAYSPEVNLDRTKEDKELEGKRNVWMILVGNLEKGLCSSTAVEFLQRHAQISATVFIFSSLSSEIYTRGAIMLHTEQNFHKLCDFLTNPNHIITSSTGRPWVIIEKQVGLKNIKASIGTLGPKYENVSQDERSRTSNNLKLVQSGTQEFQISSAMRDLFLEFSDHQVRLHKKLALMEGSVFGI
ncbi:uncharacterized protein [Cicer arietinum]|uniref:uncharacterized protein isoform X2 n=1 Tax=Cicer arietinum TaxID=3827 RepID=UPI003CC6B7C6